MIHTSYFKYLISKNKRYLIILTLIAFICIPFSLRGMCTSSTDAKSLLMIMFVISMVLGDIVSFISPIKEFNFLMKKKSNNLYFSMPIEREQLFNTTLLYSLFSSMVPIVVNYLIASIVIMFKFAFDAHCFLYLFYLVFFMLVTTMISTFGVIKSNNTLDSVIISGGYFAVPIILMCCITIYLETITYDLTLGTGTYTSSFNWLFCMLSPIYASVQAFAIESFNYLLIVYWLIIIGILVIANVRAFNNRLAEETQEKTTSMLGYPLLMSVFIFSLVLAFFSAKFNFTNTCITYLILFIIYMMMYFITVRKIEFNYKVIINYVVIILISYAFNFAYSSTLGFGQIHEMLNYNQYVSWDVEEVCFLDNGDYKDLVYTSSDRTCKDVLEALQEELLKIGPDKTGNNTISIYIRTSKVNEEGRCYHFNDDQLNDVEKVLNKFKENIKDKQYTTNSYNNALEE